jgi:hypothetical protein
MVGIKRVNLRWSEMNKVKLDLGKLILHFAQCNKSEGKSPKTVSWYSEMLTEFLKFFLGSGREMVLGILCNYCKRIRDCPARKRTITLYGPGSSKSPKSF